MEMFPAWSGREILISENRKGLSHNVICPFFIVPQNLKICGTMAEEEF
jgi:hypothetical protein